MSYQIRRISPYGCTHPIVPVVVIGGGVLGAAGFLSGKSAVMIVGAAMVALGVLAATKAAISAVLGSLGLLSGIVTSVILPSLQTADMSVSSKVLAAVLFAFAYMVLMDAMVLSAAVLYNFFGAIWGGVTMDIEETDVEEA